MLYHYQIETNEHDVVALTDQVKASVEKSGVKSGLCVVYTPHTTAGLTVTSFWDSQGV